jgi:hypothetical protein
MNPRHSTPSQEDYFHTTRVVDAFPVDDGPASSKRRGLQDVEPVVKILFTSILLAFARPRILIVLMTVSLLLPLVVALPAFQAADAHITSLQPVPGGSAIHLPQLAPSWIFSEWERAAPTELPLVAQTLPVLLLLASLCNLLFSAGWMKVALQKERGHSLRYFLRGGGRYFFPFLRTWLLGLPFFALVTWIFWGAPAEWVFEQLLPNGDAAMAASERSGRWLETLRSVLYILSLWKMEIILDLARASLVVGQRNSAFLALFRAIGFFLRSPFQVFGLLLMSFALELLWIGGVEALRHLLHWPLWTLLLLLPFGRHVMRGARYAALARYYAARTHDGVGANEEDALPTLPEMVF